MKLVWLKHPVYINLGLRINLSSRYTIIYNMKHTSHIMLINNINIIMKCLVFMLN